MYYLIPIIGIPLMYTMWSHLGTGQTDICLPISRQTPATQVIKAHSDLHFKQAVILVASTNPVEQTSVGLSNQELDGRLDCIRDNQTRAWQVQGYSLANIVVIESMNGWILVDAGESTHTTLNALEALSDLLENHTENFLPNKEIKQVRVRCPTVPRHVTHVIVTHYHTDHVGGLQGVVKWNEAVHKQSPIILAHEETNNQMLSFYLAMTRTKFRRAAKQFGTSPKLHQAPNPFSISAGIGGSFTLNHHDPPAVITPTHIWSGETFDVRVSNQNLHLLRMEGETSDHVCVHVPALRLFHIGDNFYFSFPNIYPLRGGTIRNPQVWIDSLDNFLSLYWDKTSVLTVGHTSPVFGEPNIRYVIERYRDAIAFVMHQTIRLMDHTAIIDDIAVRVNTLFWQLFPVFDSTKVSGPKTTEISNAILTDPLMPFYGQLEWAVKAIAHSQIGWFTEDPREINSHRLTHYDRTRKINAMFESRQGESVSHYIEEAIDRGDCQWALELTSLFGFNNKKSPTKDSNVIKCPVEMYEPRHSPTVHEAEEENDKVEIEFELSPDFLSSVNAQGKPNSTGDKEWLSNIETVDVLVNDSIKLENRSLANTHQVVGQKKVKLLIYPSSKEDNIDVLTETTENTIVLDPIDNPLIHEQLLEREASHRHNIEKRIHEEWMNMHCGRESDMQNSAAEPIELVDAQTMKCLRSRALLCLADKEISSSGRNWYLSEALGITDAPELDKFLLTMRDKVIGDLADLHPIIQGLSYRYIPFGDRKDPREPFTAFLTLLPNSQDKPEASRSKVSIPGAKSLNAAHHQLITYQIIHRNQVFNVKRVSSAQDIDWYAVEQYKSFEIKLQWSAIQTMFLHKLNVPRMIMDGRLQLPSVNPLPMLVFNEASSNMDFKKTIDRILNEKGKLSIGERMKCLVMFFEIMLSLESR